MALLAPWGGGVELTLTGPAALPIIPPRSADWPKWTAHPPGAADRFGESLGIVSFVLMSKPKWFVWDS